MLGPRTLPGKLKGHLKEAPSTSVLSGLLILTYGLQWVWRLVVGEATMEAIFRLEPHAPFAPLPMGLSPWAAESAVHFLGNLVGVVLFGPYVEKRLGSVPYALFVVTLGVLAGPYKAVVQGVASWGASRFSLTLAGAWFIASPAARRVRELAFYTSPPQVQRLGPWFVFTLAGVLEYSLAVAGVAVLGHSPNVAHGLALVMAVPVAASCRFVRGGLTRGPSESMRR